MPRLPYTQYPPTRKNILRIFCPITQRFLFMVHPATFADYSGAPYPAHFVGIVLPCICLFYGFSFRRHSLYRVLDKTRLKRLLRGRQNRVMQTDHRNAHGRNYTEKQYYTSAYHKKTESATIKSAYGKRAELPPNTICF